MNYNSRHDKTVNEIAAELNGMVLLRAPFDIIDSNRHFYDIKYVHTNTRKTGIKPHGPTIWLTENEAKFADRYSDFFTIILFYNGQRFDIPYNMIRERIRFRRYSGSWNDVEVVQIGLSLGQRILCKFHKHENINKCEYCKYMSIIHHPNRKPVGRDPMNGRFIKNKQALEGKLYSRSIP